MKALFIPEARMMFASIGADGTSSYTIERYGNIAHLWSSYARHRDGKQVARGINSIQAIKEAGGWRVTGVMVQAESAAAPFPRNICREGGVAQVQFGSCVELAETCFVLLAAPIPEAEVAEIGAGLFTKPFA